MFGLVPIRWELECRSNWCIGEVRRASKEVSRKSDDDKLPTSLGW
jgi:hypothetical protein